MLRIELPHGQLAYAKNKEFYEEDICSNHDESSDQLLGASTTRTITLRHVKFKCDIVFSFVTLTVSS